MRERDERGERERERGEREREVREREVRERGERERGEREPDRQENNGGGRVQRAGRFIIIKKMFFYKNKNISI